jgi:hypothetical protein
MLSPLTYSENACDHRDSCWRLQPKSTLRMLPVTGGAIDQ